MLERIIELTAETLGANAAEIVADAMNYLTEHQA